MKNNAQQLNAQALANDYSRLFIKDPLFMFFCPDKSERASFIQKYFLYYIDRWRTDGAFVSSKNKSIAASLADPDNFRFRFSGRKSFAMKFSRYSCNVLNHMEIVQSITNIVAPVQMKKKVLSVYAAPEVCEDDIIKIIERFKKEAENENYVLVYETLSKRFTQIFEECGFETSYARQFMNTQFFQTVMTYNI